MGALLLTTLETILCISPVHGSTCVCLHIATPKNEWCPLVALFTNPKKRIPNHLHKSALWCCRVTCTIVHSPRSLEFRKPWLVPFRHHLPQSGRDVLLARLFAPTNHSFRRVAAPTNHSFRRISDKMSCRKTRFWSFQMASHDQRLASK